MTTSLAAAKEMIIHAAVMLVLLNYEGFFIIKELITALFSVEKNVFALLPTDFSTSFGKHRETSRLSSDNTPIGSLELLLPG